jgi:hypothetical protein
MSKHSKNSKSDGSTIEKHLLLKRTRKLSSADIWHMKQLFPHISADIIDELADVIYAASIDCIYAYFTENFNEDSSVNT